MAKVSALKFPLNIQTGQYSDEEDQQSQEPPTYTYRNKNDNWVFSDDKGNWYERDEKTKEEYLVWKKEDDGYHKLKKDPKNKVNHFDEMSKDVSTPSKQFDKKAQQVQQAKSSVKKSVIKNPFNEQERLLKSHFEQLLSAKEPSVYMRDKSDHNLFSIAYNNSIIFYNEDNRKLTQWSVLDKDVTETDEGCYIEKDKKVFERSFDAILKDAQIADDGNIPSEKEEEEGGEEEKKSKYAGEQETVISMIPIYDDYKIVLGSNKGNIYVLNAFDFSYHEAFKIKDSPVLDLVVGKNHVYSLHENGKVYKSNFKNEASNDFEQLIIGEEGKILSFKISANQQWLALCQQLKPENEKDKPTHDIVIQDLSEDMLKSFSDDEGSSDSQAFESESKSDYSGGEKEGVKEIRYSIELTTDDLEEQEYDEKDYEHIKDLEPFKKIKFIYQFTPDSKNIVIRTTPRVLESFLVDKVDRISNIEKICEDKSRVMKFQVLADNKTILCISGGDTDQQEDLKLLDLQLTKKKISLGCNNVKDFVCTSDVKMVFCLDYNNKESKSTLTCLDIETQTKLASFQIENPCILLDISPDNNFLYSFDRFSKTTMFVKLADFYMNIPEQNTIMDDKQDFLMQLNKKTKTCELWDLKLNQIIGLYPQSVPQTVCGEYFYSIQKLEDKEKPENASEEEEFYQIFRVNTKTKEKQVCSDKLDYKVYDLQVSKNNKYAYCMSSENLISFDIEKKSVLSKARFLKSDFKQNYRCFQLSHNETFIIGVSDKKMYRFYIEDGKLMQPGKDQEVPWKPQRLDAFHPSDSYMLTRDFNSDEIVQFSLTVNKEPQYINGHTKTRVEYTCFVENGKKLLTMNDRQLIYWHVTDTEFIKLEQVNKKVTPVYGHNKKLTGLRVGKELKPWSPFLIYQLSGNFAELGKVKQAIEKSPVILLYKAALKSIQYIQGPYNKLFPFMFKMFDDYKEEEDPDKLAMIEHMTKHVISPQGFTLLGYFTYINSQAFIKRALTSDPIYIRDINGNFPLTLALKSKSKTSTNMLVEHVSKDQKKIALINHTEICQLLEFSPSNLIKLISNSAAQIRGADPLGIDKNEDLTDFYLTNNIVPRQLHDNLCDTEAKLEDKKPVIYKHIAFKMNLLPGSKESIEFHTALSKCTDPEVFSSDVIKYILEYKWQILYVKTFPALLVSVILQILLLWHVYTPGQVLALYCFLAYAILLTLIEMFRFFAAGFEYCDKINLINICLLQVYSLTTMNVPNYFVDFILPTMNILSWIQIVSQLRSIQSIRQFMVVLTESLASIKDFLVFFSIMIFMFMTSSIIQDKVYFRHLAFERLQKQYADEKKEFQMSYSENIYLEAEKTFPLNQDDFADYKLIYTKREEIEDVWSNLFNTYLQMLGEFGLDSRPFTYFDEIIFIGLTFILCVTLLNLVVALMSSAYEEFKELKESKEQRALNLIILKAEVEILATRNESRYDYLIWMEYQEENDEKQTEMDQIIEKLDQNDSNWEVLLAKTKHQETMSEKANATLDMVQNDVEDMKMEVEGLKKDISKIGSQLGQLINMLSGGESLRDFDSQPRSQRF